MKTSIAIFKTHLEAEAALNKLQNLGFDIKKLSIVTKNVDLETQVMGDSNIEGRAKYWSKQIAMFGGLWGLFFVTAFFFVPGMVAALEPSLVVGGLGALGAGLCRITIPKDSLIDNQRKIKVVKFNLVACGTEDEIKTFKKSIKDDPTHHSARQHYPLNLLRQMYKSHIMLTLRNKFHTFFTWSFALIYISILFASNTLAESEPSGMSLEQLGKIEIASVTANENEATDSQDSVFVLDKIVIVSSSATSVSDLLRLVPGLKVIKVNSNSWAVTSWGLNSDSWSNLVVLVDGQSDYDPTFSGVNSDLIDLIFNDIKKIEVIRGRRAVALGIGNFDGVINILTKEPEDSDCLNFPSQIGTENAACSKSNSEVKSKLTSRSILKTN